MKIINNCSYLYLQFYLIITLSHSSLRAHCPSLPFEMGMDLGEREASAERSPKRVKVVVHLDRCLPFKPFHPLKFFKTKDFDLLLMSFD